MRSHIGLFLAACAAFSACHSNESTEKYAVDTRSYNIVHGSRDFDPSIVNLTSGQLLALGYLHHYGTPEKEFCTGTIITPWLVVTARHCVHDDKNCSDDETQEVITDGDCEPDTEPDEIQFSIGQYTNRSPTYTFDVQQIYYNMKADAALLVLSEDATQAVRGLTPIPFNREGDSALRQQKGKKVQVAGYGNNEGNHGSDYNNGRFFAEVRLTDFDDKEITVDGEGEEGICDGDSGGPCMWTINGSVAVVAVESRGSYSCVDDDQMTRLDKLANWIDHRDPEKDVSSCGIPNEGYCEGNVAYWCDEETETIYERNCFRDNSTCVHRDDGYGNYCESIADQCAGLEYEGVCVGNAVLYCYEHQVKALFCDDGKVCGYNEETGYDCLSYGVQDTSCGTLTEVGACYGEQAVWCSDGTVYTENCDDFNNICALTDNGFRCRPAVDCGSLFRTYRCEGDVIVTCDPDYGEYREDCGELGMTCAGEADSFECVEREDAGVDAGLDDGGTSDSGPEQDGDVIDSGPQDSEVIDASVNHCEDISEYGICDQNLLKWCERGEIHTADCTVRDQVCGYDQSLKRYRCLNGGGDGGSGGGEAGSGGGEAGAGGGEAGSGGGEAGAGGGQAGAGGGEAGSGGGQAGAGGGEAGSGGGAAGAGGSSTEIPSGDPDSGVSGRHDDSDTNAMGCSATPGSSNGFLGILPLLGLLGLRRRQPSSRR